MSKTNIPYFEVHIHSTSDLIFDWDEINDSLTNMGQFEVFYVDQNSICQDHGTQATVKIARTTR